MSIKKYLIIIVIFIASFLRLLQLGNAPYGFMNDEVSYIYSGYTIAKTGGYDLAGKFLPLSIQTDSSLSPVPVYILATWFSFIPMTPLSARLPFALLGVGAVFLTYLLIKRMFNNTSIALLSSFVLSISPWHILITRGVWDGVAALFFYLLAIYLFIRFVNSSKLFLSLPAFLFAFYSYHATKIFFIVLIPVLLIVYKDKLFKNKRNAGLFIVGILSILVSFYFVTIRQGVTRQEVFIWSENNISEIVKRVDYERQKSTAPFILRQVYSNKVTVMSQMIFEKYTGIFSPEHLFTQGDVSRMFGYGNFIKGAFYLVEAPFLLFGFYTLLKLKNKSTKALIILLLIIAPLPAVVSTGRTYFIRGIMLSPFIACLIGLGIHEFYITAIKNKQKYARCILISLAVLIYLISISRFIYNYYYQFSSVGAEYWFGSSRTLVRFLETNKDKYKSIYVANAEKMLLLQYGFFTNSDPAKIYKIWHDSWPVKIDNIEFDIDCFTIAAKKQVLNQRPVLLVMPASCKEKLKPTTAIADPIEPISVLWKIYELK